MIGPRLKATKVVNSTQVVRGASFDANVIEADASPETAEPNRIHTTVCFTCSGCCWRVEEM